jgi:putative Holliday junction resolvase
MRRVLALDIGTVRIGVAVTDPLGLTAQGIGVWQVNARQAGAQQVGAQHVGVQQVGHWRTKFEECLARYDPELVLIGLPRRTDGTYGPEAKKIEKLAETLRAAYPDRRFETWDERYTTVLAQRALLEGDVSRKKRKECVDKIAASLILQSWLESVRQEAGI